MKKCKKYPCMKRMIPIAIVFMTIFSAFSIISLVDSAKAWIPIPPPDPGDGNGPVVSNIPDQTIDTDESFANINLDNYVDDPDNNPDQIDWILSGASDLTVNIDSNRVATVTFPSGWSGSDTITFIAWDPDRHFDSDPATFTVVNNDPVASNDLASVQANSANNQINILSNDNDPDGDGISIMSVENPSHGSTSDDGTYAYYTPNPGYFGLDSFTYTISDGHGGSDSATVSISIASNPLTFPDSHPFGEEFEFTSDPDVASAGSSISVCSLTPSCFIVGYGVDMGDMGDDGWAGVRVGLVTDSGIEYGPEYAIPSYDFSGLDIVKVAALDNNHFILTYPSNQIITWGLTARRGTVSGNTISFSSKANVEAGFGTNTGYTIDVLSSSRFIVAFYEENPSRGSNMEIHIGNIAGNTITFDPDDEIDLDDIVGHTLDYHAPVKVAGLDDKHFVISYSYISGDHTYAAARIFEIYAPIPCDPRCVQDPRCECYRDEFGSIMGSEYTFAGLGAYNAYISSVCALDSSHFVVRYKEGQNYYTAPGKTIVGTVSDTDISFGSPKGNNFPSIVKSLDSTHFVAAGGGTSGGTVKQGTISGNSINPIVSYTFRDEDTKYVDVSRLDSEHFVVAFKDVTSYGFQNYPRGPGKAMILPASVFDNNGPDAVDDSVSTVPHECLWRLMSYLEDDAHPDFEPYREVFGLAEGGPYVGFNLIDNDEGDNIEITKINGIPYGDSCYGETDHGRFTVKGLYWDAPEYDVFYQPDGPQSGGYHGVDSFTYTIEDQYGNSDTATVTINVETIGQSPAVNSISDQIIIEGQDFNPINLWSYGSDPDNNNNELKWYYGLSDPISVPLDIQSDGTAIMGTSFGIGSIDIYFQVMDKYGNSDGDWVTFTIEGNIEPPNKPSIEGGIMVCYTGIEYTFNSVLTNPGSNTKYYFHWDDGVEIPDTDDWISISGPGPLTLSEIHKWDNAGVYDIKVYVVTEDPITHLPINLKSLPLPVQVLHKSENPEDG